MKMQKRHKRIVCCLLEWCLRRIFLRPIFKDIRTWQRGKSKSAVFQSQADVERLPEAALATGHTRKNRISMVVMGFTNIFKRPIVGAEDIQGLKIRTVQNPLLLEFFLAVVARPLPFTELFSALQRGMVDGQNFSKKMFISSSHRK